MKAWKEFTSFVESGKFTEMAGKITVGWFWGVLLLGTFVFLQMM